MNRRLIISMLMGIAVISNVASPGSRYAVAVERHVEFGRDVFPILQRSCVECHGPRREEGGLRLDEREQAIATGAIEPGSPDESELFRRIRLPRGHEEAMPAIGEPLPFEQIELIREWIVQGADWPQGLESRKHWSYVAPASPELPKVSNSSWCRSPMDYFVLKRLDASGLSPSPAAAPEKLLRRVFLDLIGLPPTPSEVDAFAAQPTSERFEEIVDELLRRPQFGEKWARHWLDLARYADSHGFQRDDLRDIWAYRDWVIRALNDDLPFDRFTIEQLAGDLLPDSTESQKIATGFHRCAPTNVEAGSLPEETRIEQVIDRVNTTASVWLGTTLECCQCHDHKYDPFTQKEYYQLLAFFNSTALEADRTDPKTASSIKFQGPFLNLANAERDGLRKAHQEELEGLRALQAARIAELASQLEAWSTEFSKSVDDAPRSHLLTLDRFRSEGTTDSYEQLEDGSILLVGGDPPDTDTSRADQDAKSTGFQQRIVALEKEIEQLAPDTTLAMVELDQPRPSRLLRRGDYRQPDELVYPATPAVLHVMPQGPANRLTLAKWLVARENPLVARVVVNRWWAELFGRGIVKTVEDFGIKGESPSHPDLLDWLAVEFVESGWSMKRLLKTIVLSATYQQSSNVTPLSLERDPQNRMLARGPRFRMDAEMIRDNALSIAGLLSLRQFGPPIRPYQPDGIWTKVGGQAYKYEVSPGEEQYRRGVYVIIKRGSPYPSLINFDATPRLTCTEQRSRTNTPLQALTLLNDPVYLAAAESLAARILTDRTEATLDEKISYAFQLCTARRPTHHERQTLIDLIQQTLYNESSQDAKMHRPPAQASIELKAWTSLATVLLNLHETITKD